MFRIGDDNTDRKCNPFKLERLIVTEVLNKELKRLILTISLSITITITIQRFRNLRGTGPFPLFSFFTGYTYILP